jgi:hypothetical protein
VLVVVKLDSTSLSVKREWVYKGLFKVLVDQGLETVSKLRG